MRMIQNQFEKWIKEKVLLSIKDYPTRALVYNLIRLNREQEKRKIIGDGYLDGTAWSPKKW